MFAPGAAPAKRLRLSSLTSLPRPSLNLRTRTSTNTSSQSLSTSPPTSQHAHKSHLKKPPSVPNPLPALYRQQVLLSDGSSYTTYTTAPSPSFLRLTRDVTNNPLWNPLSEGKKGEGEEEGGRLARFRARFGGAAPGAKEAGEAAGAGAPAFGTEDFGWMSEGGVVENISAKDMAGPVKKSTKKK